METKTFKGFKAEPSGAFTVVFATKRDAAGELVIDRQGDIYGDDVMVNGSAVIGCWNHSACASPAGMGRIVEDGKDVRLAGRLNMDSEHGRREFDVWKALGDKAEFSYTFDVLDSEPAVVRGRRVRRLLKMRVHSVDLVQNPAGHGTRVVDLKTGAMMCDCGCNKPAGDCPMNGKGELQAIKAQHDLRQQRQRYEAIACQLTGKGAGGINAINGVFAYVAAEPLPDAKEAAMAGLLGGLGCYDVMLPGLRFYRPAASGEKALFSATVDLLGRADRKENTVWIRFDLDEKEAEATAVHELIHIANPFWTEQQVEEATAVYMEGGH